MKLPLLIASAQAVMAVLVLLKELYEVSSGSSRMEDEWKNFLAFPALPSGALWGADGLPLHMLRVGVCVCVCGCGEQICSKISHV